MNRRMLIQAALGAVTSFAVSCHGSAQDASLTSGVQMRARREFYGNDVDMRTDVYLFADRESAKRGFADFSEWASRDQDDPDDLIVTDSREYAKGTGGFGKRTPISLHYMDRIDGLVLFTGEAVLGSANWSTAPVMTLVMQVGRLVHVWRVISEIETVLIDEVHSHFSYVPHERGNYTEDIMLSRLPEAGDLIWINGGSDRGEMTLEEVVDYR